MRTLSIIEAGDNIKAINEPVTETNTNVPEGITRSSDENLAKLRCPSTVWLIISLPHLLEPKDIIHVLT